MASDFNNRLIVKGCPCRGCTDRKLLCHGACRRFQDWQKKVEEVRKAEQNDRMFLINDDRLKELQRKQKQLRRWKRHSVHND